MLQRGEVNTRWRDFADVVAIAARHSMEETELRSALADVATHRRAILEPLIPVLDSVPPIAQAKWELWRLNQAHRDSIPEHFSDALSRIAELHRSCTWRSVARPELASDEMPMAIAIDVLSIARWLTSAPTEPPQLRGTRQCREVPTPRTGSTHTPPARSHRSRSGLLSVGLTPRGTSTSQLNRQQTHMIGWRCASSTIPGGGRE
jgi:hypothetical protein